MNKPIILITSGDPAGVGAEISVKAMLDPDVRAQCTPVLVGDASPVRAAMKACGIRAPLFIMEHISAPSPESDCIHLFPVNVVKDGEWEYGRVSPLCGKASYKYIETAIHAAMAHRIPAVVTAPINKEALRMAGCPHEGHTEIFASLTGTEKYAMMLSAGALNVIHATTHLALADACRRLTKERICDVIRLAHQAMTASGIEQPRIAVAGLNPHSGENGLFGREEILEIAPAIKQCRLEGISVAGPVPPDSVFVKAVGGLYDIVVAMYHDQGHIPVKLLGFRLSGEGGQVSGVNTTVGLPFVRTSVDHGTAFDIAGKGVADETSMVESILLAIKMSQNNVFGRNE